MVVVSNFNFRLFGVEIAGLVELTRIKLRNLYVSFEIVVDAERIAGEEARMVAGLDRARAVVVVDFCDEEVVDEAAKLVSIYLEGALARKVEAWLFVNRAERVAELDGALVRIGSQHIEGEVRVEAVTQDLLRGSGLYDIAFFEGAFNRSQQVRVSSK